VVAVLRWASRQPRSPVRPDRFLDVGAGVGYFSVLAADTADGVQVDSVEPNPETVDLLRFNLWVNHVGATLWPLALTDERRALPLDTIAESNLGDTRGVPLLAEQSYSVVAPAIAADELFQGRAFDVVKIDGPGLGKRRPSRHAANPPRVARNDGYRRMGLHTIVVRDKTLEDLADEGVIVLCDSAGPEGSVNLLLRRR
jgi:FkbM family methyltransferase